jgi:hypothetical protein
MSHDNEQEDGQVPSETSPLLGKPTVVASQTIAINATSPDSNTNGQTTAPNGRDAENANGDEPPAVKLSLLIPALSAGVSSNHGPSRLLAS